MQLFAVNPASFEIHRALLLPVALYPTRIFSSFWAATCFRVINSNQPKSLPAIALEPNFVIMRNPLPADDKFIERCSLASLNSPRYKM